MTRNAGMLWKTPWRRRTGGLVSQPPVDMWFFDLGGTDQPNDLDRWYFESVAAAPSFADGSDSFWFGVVSKAGGFPSGTFVADQVSFQQSLATDGFYYVANAFLDGEPLGYEIQNSVAEVRVMDAILNSRFLTSPSSPGAIPGVLLNYNWDTVTVYFCRVTLNVGNVTVEAWLDNVYLGSVASSNPYTAAAANIVLRGSRYVQSGPSVHGAAGGKGAVMDEQVADWFAAVKAGAQVVGIPGLTTALWSAAAVAPTVPNPLPNLAGGQGLFLQFAGAPIAPASNVLVPVSFNY